jgi:predicted GTPase
MGYGPQQIQELQSTIDATDADVVVEGTPIDLKRILETDKPIANVSYELEELEPGGLATALEAVMSRTRAR